MDARAGIGVTDERQQLATPPKPSVPEHLVPSGAAPVRRLPIGAEPQSDSGVHFRIWAPRCREVVVEIEGFEPAALQFEIGGYFSLWSLPARAGMRYRFRLDRGERAFPDPASRFQPEGGYDPDRGTGGCFREGLRPPGTGLPVVGIAVSRAAEIARTHDIPIGFGAPSHRTARGDVASTGPR